MWLDGPIIPKLVFQEDKNEGEVLYMKLLAVLMKGSF
jgi:hypothetical protein